MGAAAIRDQAIARSEGVSLRLPVTQIGMTAMREHDGDTGPLVHVVQVDAIDVNVRHECISFTHSRVVPGC